MKLPTIEQLTDQAWARGANPSQEQIDRATKILADAQAAYESGEDTSTWEDLHRKQEEARQEQARLQVETALLATGNKPLPS